MNETEKPLDHKYLSELGIKRKDFPWNWNKNDSRQKKWARERKVYGFDERDTWSLDHTLSLMIYERLRWFRQHSPVEMDAKGVAHSYEYKGEEFTLGEMIDKALSGFKMSITLNKHEITENNSKKIEEAWAILGIIHCSLWW